MAKVEAYAADPDGQANKVKRLKGSSAIYRLRVGNYRVVFVLTVEEVVVTAIGPRGSVYE